MVLIQCMCQAVLCMFLFIGKADSEMKFETLRPRYSVGDRVVLRCIIDNRHWITASIQRDDEEIAVCFLPPSSCGRTLASKPNYSYSMDMDVPTVTVENVTIDDHDVLFKCKWLRSEAAVSFHVNNKSATHYKQKVDAPRLEETGVKNNDLIVSTPVNSDVTIDISMTVVGLCYMLFFVLFSLS